MLLHLGVYIKEGFWALNTARKRTCMHGNAGKDLLQNGKAPADQLDVNHRGLERVGPPASHGVMVRSACTTCAAGTRVSGSPEPHLNAM